MFHFLLTIATFAMLYRAISRGGDASEMSAAIITGLLLSVVQGFAFMAGGWWDVAGYSIFLFASARFILTSTYSFAIPKAE